MYCERTCSLGLFSKPTLPEKSFNEAMLESIRNLTKGIFRNSKLRDIFLIIYSYLQGGTVITPYKLFRMLSEAEAAKIKSAPALANYMERLAKLAFIERIEGPHPSYKMNPDIADQFKFLVQIPRDPWFKQQLESSYVEVFTLTCIIARILKEFYPTKSGQAIFDLTRALIEIGTRIACEELREQHVLERECYKCGFPYTKRQVPAAEALQNALSPDLPLLEQILRFIATMDQGEGVAKSAILEYFTQYSYTTQEIDEVVEALYREGVLFQLNSGAYKVPIWRNYRL